MLFRTEKKLNPQDPDQKLYYARPVYNRTLDLKELEKDIRSRYNINPLVLETAVNVLADLLLQYLAQGYKIKAGDLGIFALSFKSSGKGNVEDVGKKDITNIKITYLAGKRLKDKLKTLVDFKHTSS